MKRTHKTGSLWASLPILCLAISTATAAQSGYRSPQDVVVSPDGATLYVADKTAAVVVLLDTASGKPLAQIDVPGEPNGLALSDDGRTLYVAERTAHAVAVIDTASRQVTRRIQVGFHPVDVAVASNRRRLYTANQGDDSVSVVDLTSGQEIQRVEVVREPVAVDVAPDGSQVVVANLLPQGVGTDPTLAACVSLIDASSHETTHVKLPAGSTVVRDVRFSPDGRWVYAVHVLGRFNLPITQLDRGWVHTHALSIIDPRSGSLTATVLLDNLTSGSADPWAIALSSDGATLWVSQSGVHEVSRVNLRLLHDLLKGNVSQRLAGIKDGIRENIWTQISQDPSVIPRLANDLTALYIADAIRRLPTGGGGPRGLAISPQGDTLYAANYFSGTIGVLNTSDERSAPGAIPLGVQPAPDAARRGEAYFHDATRCFQRWHSCATCHPSGRVDALPWDFLRDGIGNGKDVISLVHVLHTSPHNRRATRPNPRECMRTGVIGGHMVTPEAADVEDLLAYMGTLLPEPNPRVASGSPAAVRGKVLFEGQAGCAACHPAPLFTDRKTHNVGLLTASEPDGRYDTPTLVECYRTSPYFHDGRAATLGDALTVHNATDRHGATSDLTEEELDDLVAYVLSL